MEKKRLHLYLPPLHQHTDLRDLEDVQIEMQYTPAPSLATPYVTYLPKSGVLYISAPTTLMYNIPGDLSAENAGYISPPGPKVKYKLVSGGIFTHTPGRPILFSYNPHISDEAQCNPQGHLSAALEISLAPVTWTQPTVIHLKVKAKREEGWPRSSGSSARICEFRILRTPGVLRACAAVWQSSKDSRETKRDAMET
jgi:hypothetical protein